MWEHAGPESEAPWRVMGACGLVKPGQERKPWVGERVHEHMGLKAWLQNRGANEAHRVAMLNEVQRANVRIQKEYKSDVGMNYSERMTQNRVIDRNTVGSRSGTAVGERFPVTE